MRHTRVVRQRSGGCLLTVLKWWFVIWVVFPMLAFIGWLLLAFAVPL